MALSDAPAFEHAYSGETESLLHAALGLELLGRLPLPHLANVDGAPAQSLLLLLHCKLNATMRVTSGALREQWSGATAAGATTTTTTAAEYVAVGATIV